MGKKGEERGRVCGEIFLYNCLSEYHSLFPGLFVITWEREGLWGGGRVMTKLTVIIATLLRKTIIELQAESVLKKDLLSKPMGKIKV